MARVRRRPVQRLHRPGDRRGEPQSVRPQVVPGLLQTRAYAEAVITGALPETPTQEIEKRVQVRMRRQDRVTEDGPLRLWTVLDEAALRRVVGSRSLMREQLEHLVETSQLPHVTLQVLPFGAGAHPGLNGQYSILEFPDTTDSSVVYIEGVTSDLYLEKAPDVQNYSVMYEHLRAQALSTDQTRQFIADIAKDYAR